MENFGRKNHVATPNQLLSIFLGVENFGRKNHVATPNQLLSIFCSCTQQKYW